MEYLQKPLKYIDIYRNNQEYIQLSFPYSSNTIAYIRALPGRKWIPDLNSWIIPRNTARIDALILLGFSMSPAVKRWYTANKGRVYSEAFLQRTQLDTPLFPYQQEGVRFIESRNGRALISDEPGLGKSAEAASWLYLRQEVRPVLIVCPAVLKLNWVKEIRMWTSDKRIQVLKGHAPSPLRGDIIIINYDILHKWRRYLKAYRFKALIIDEIHLLKEDKSRRTKTLRLIAKNIPHVIGLTGTPIINRPIEIFNAASIIQPSLFPSRWAFGRRYCDGHFDRYGWNFKGASNLEELHTILTSSIMIRRLKEDVLKELPPKIRMAVPLEIDNAKYAEAIEALNIWFKKEENATPARAMIEIEKLKQVAVHLKLEQTIEWIETYISGGSKLIVFCAHTDIINTLYDRFKHMAVMINGQTRDDAARQKAIDDFQTKDTIQLFFGNLRAAGVGITLTAASATAFIETLWSPSDMLQAEDRAHRVGQTADCVYAYYLVAAGTIEEYIVKVIDDKAKVVNRVIDGRGQEDDAMLTGILRQLNYGA